MDVQEDEGVRRVTLHDATLTVSNDQSPYFQSSPLPLPVAVPEACRLARIPAMGSQARRNDSHLPGNARHLVRKLRLRRIRMAIWSVEGGSDGSTQGHLGQNREASTWARRR
ncbi:30S ribosomal protein S14 [Trichinella spiralis]|uniref:30S ribosomal protein S14 n=1 Tax=Trichinella spiralis TaxID=6334 RepID=UPI0001EFE10D|nr:30S ribosomal protein S14 [Trichinella spiralis]